MTSTSGLRKHLFTEHIEEWSTSCKDLNISITAKAALEAILEFNNQPSQAPSNPDERPEYSKEAFIEAIVEFIVGDDQACSKFFLFITLSEFSLVHQYY
jgi:hypothetical protein